MTREDYRSTLEAIARSSSSDAARVSAVRQLRDMDAEDADRAGETAPGGFDDLDEVPETSNVARIRVKRAA